MDNFKVIKEIFDDMENLLDALLLSGIYIASDKLSEDIKTIEGRLGLIGMEEGKKLLKEFENKLSMQRHRMDYDDMEIVAALTKLETYIEAVKLKINLEISKQNIYKDVVK
ncbi:hypothetical protein IAI10_14715 [Clostridium sp. 19966]|uniref:hypothetical protein n=1 Tax=Clostridium sp. 19966 TaxID=2768166 RepID=UPI0028DF265B|nr:hypothetical protein [Clostridium sp. 19966]MDT8717915.1 hypothetical protein [Clostridium sp. 19966]